MSDCRSDSQSNTKSNVAVIVILSALAVLAFAFSIGLVLMQKRETSVSENLPSDGDAGKKGVDYVSRALSDSEYPSLEQKEEQKEESPIAIQQSQQDEKLISIHTRNIETTEVAKSADTTEPNKMDTATPTSPVKKKTITHRNNPIEQKSQKSQKSPPPKAKSSQPAKPSQPRYRQVTEDAYWVQIIAASKPSTAEDIRDKLAELGFTAQILVQENSDKVIYRVRIGAFSQKAEADEYVQRISKLEGLGDSYVSRAPVTRRILVNRG